jgi:hypothetical protein
MNRTWDGPLFEANRERWSLFCPEGAAWLSLQKNLPANNVRIVQSDKELNLQLNIEGEWLNCEGDDPIAEAAEWLKQIDIDSCEVLYVYGLGLGYIFDQLTDWLAKPDHHLVFIEDNINVIGAFLTTERANKILIHPQVWVYYKDYSKSKIELFIEIFAMKKPKVVALPFYFKNFKGAFDELKVKIEFIRNMQFRNANEFRALGFGFIPNYIGNLKFLPKAYLGNRLFGKFKGVPAIICGAGPSLMKNIDLLHKLGDKAIIFAGGSAMNVINAHGIIPHCAVGIDPNFEQGTRVIMQKVFEIPFFYRNRMSCDALELAGGDRVFLSGSSGYDIADYFEKDLDLPKGDLEEGCNVINFSLSIAANMGCNPIILIGVDLAYSSNQSYAEGVTNHPIHYTKSLFRTKEQTEELILQLDIYGQPIYTLWKWITESLWFSAFADRHPEINLINATEGGIGFKGVKNKPLKEVADELLGMDLDLHARMHAELQDNPVEKSMTKNQLRDMLVEFQKSLKHLAENLRPHDETVDENNFKEEIGFQYLLKSYGKAFDSFSGLKARRIEIDSAFYSEEEKAAKKRNLMNERYAYFQQVAACTYAMIDNQLKRQERLDRFLEGYKDNIIDVGITPVDDLSCYSYEDGELKIIDPSFNLNHIEKFTADPQGELDLIHDDEGRLKYECFRKNGHLHGPSRSYGSNGQLLSESWYIDGLQQGLSHRYYLDGSLYSIGKFKDGKPQGQQERFWANGQRRSLINYHQGALHGELLMFHENGIKARELTFFEGKRQGFERIWSVWGQLMMEAEFAGNRPCGTACVWYDNGALAQETKYDKTGKLLSVSRWNFDGTPLDIEESKQADFFQNVVVQTGTLTDNLELVIDRFTEFVPLINEAAKKQDASQQVQDLTKGLEDLNKELANLQNIQSQMHFESGLDPENPSEGIWKTPSMQRDVQLKLEAMTSQMNEGLAKLKRELGEAIQKIHLKQVKEKDKNDGPKV